MIDGHRDRPSARSPANPGCEGQPQDGDGLVGRAGELEQIARLLDQRTRLVTIVGRGGVGKTALARTLVARCRAVFDAAVTVTVTSSTGEDGLLPDIARVAGLDLSGHSPAERVQSWLGDRRVLLVVDNAEDCLAALEPVVGLVDRCAQVQLLVTSRVPVCVPWEVLVEVLPLPTPSGSATEVGEVTASAAVELFAREARRVDPAFAVRASNASDVSTICRLLDGLPLAIELAAARVRVLSAGEIATGLHRGLELVDPAGVLRAIIDWTVTALADSERQLLRSLAVFPRGFIVESAHAVSELGPNDVLAGLDSLVRFQLIRTVSGPDSPRRFEMFESIRQFALQDVSSSGESEAANSALARWAVGVAERNVALRDTVDAARGLSTIDDELDNLRAALDWLATHRPGDDAVRLGTALARYWWARGSFGEGRRWLEPLVGSASADVALLANAQMVLVDLAIEQSRYDDAERCLAVARERFSSSGNRLGLAQCDHGVGIVARHRGDLDLAMSAFTRAGAEYQELNELRRCADVANDCATVAYHRGDLAAALAFASQAIAHFRECGARDRLALALCNFAAYLLESGDPRRSVVCLEEVLDLAADLGDVRQRADALANLADARLSLGEINLAEAAGTEALATARQLGDRLLEAFCLQTLATGSQARGDVAGGARRWLAALTIFTDIDYGTGIATTLEQLAGVAGAIGEHGCVVSLLAASEQFRSDGGTLPEPALGPLNELRDDALAQLPPEDGDRLRRAARRWEPSTMIDAVTALVARVVQPSPDSLSVQRQFVHAGLTNRESEIAEHVTRGRSDAQIAAELYISRRTVTTHVATILRKLGVSSRRDVVRVVAADLVERTAGRQALGS